MFRIFCVMLISLVVTSCGLVSVLDRVIPDNRTEYKKAESLPELEVPPDLTADAVTDSMGIPNERQATLSQFRRQHVPVAGAAARGALAQPADVPQGRQMVTVRGSRSDAWPKLKTFFTDKGYSLDLDDVELGVLETGWSPPATEGGLVYHYKYKVFSEPGVDPGVTLLFISGSRQEQITAVDGSTQWLDQEMPQEVTKQIAADLDQSINGSASVAQVGGVAESAVGAQTRSRPRAEMKNTEDGKLYLAIPEEFTGAWRYTGTALQRAGFTIADQDAAKGIYHITYMDSAGNEGKKGWLSKLAFWKNDEPRSKSYRLSLTGMGERTELVVLNDAGDWETNEDAGRILAVIQNQYNTR